MYGNPQQGQNTDDVMKLRQEAGLWLRALREEAGLSQRDLARAINIDYYTFVSQVESGRGRVPPNQYAAWAKAVRVEPHDFAKNMLRFYDPVTYEMLFEGEPKQFAPVRAAKKDPKMTDLVKRLTKLEAMVTQRSPK